MATTVDGLISGLDTTTIVNQLMQIQAGPQNRLKSTLTSTQQQVTAFQALNTKMAALQTAAESVDKPGTWSAATATSSSPSVVATTTTGALVGSLTFSVTQLAAAKSSISTQTFTSLTDAGAITATPLEIHGSDGTLRATITPVGTSLADVVRAVNSDPDSGLSASAVQVSTGVYRLQLTAKDSGTSGDFTMTGSGGAPLTGLDFTLVTAARDALVHVGDVGAGYDVTSASNTLEGLLPGVTLQLTGVANDVTVQLTRDTSAMTTAVQSMVDSLNAALETIKAQGSAGSVDGAGKRVGAGALSGESSLRTLTANLLRTVTSGIGGKSLSSVGISTTRDGTLSFDAKVFEDALAADPAADPAAVQAMFSSATPGAVGLATAVADLAKRTSSSTGTIAASIDGRTSTIRDLTKRIADWDDRLAASKEALQRQYAALELTLGRMQNQATWLNGQISSLGKSS